MVLNHAESPVAVLGAEGSAPRECKGRQEEILKSLREDMRRIAAGERELRERVRSACQKGNQR